MGVVAYQYAVVSVSPAARLSLPGGQVRFNGGPSLSFAGMKESATRQRADDLLFGGALGLDLTLMENRQFLFQFSTQYHLVSEMRTPAMNGFIASRRIPMDYIFLGFTFGLRS